MKSNFKPSSNVRLGFTVVELLVAIAIIGLLMAIIVPAVQSVRETSRATECRSHLHQFGIALQAFEAVHHRLPSPAGPRESQNQFYWPFSPHFHLLPQLEQRALYDTVDFTQTPIVYANSIGAFHLAVQEPIPVLLCPSDAGVRGTNYRVCLGMLGHRTTIEARDPRRGAFNILGGTSYADILDGSSQSVAMSERYQSDEQFGSFSRLDFWYSGLLALGGIPSNEEMLAIAGGLDSTPAVFNDRVGFDWYRASFSSTWYNHLLTPNSQILDCSMDSHSFSASNITGPFGPMASSVGLHAARSFHPAGVHVLMLDGAVDVVSNTVDQTAWQELGTVASHAN